MINPPFLARILLRTAAPRSVAHFVEADLADEFQLREASEARQWYWKQVLGSMVPLLAAELRAAEWEITALALILSTWGQIVLIDRWWSFVLSQIPFKEDIMRGPTYAAIGMAIAFFCTMIAGTRCNARGLILAMPACVLFTMFGLAASWGITPVWFAMAITACNMAGLSTGAAAKYWREQ